MDVLFLDATILFAAAYRPNAGLRRLWGLEGVELVSSHYACGEAQFNLLGRAPRGSRRQTEQEQIEKLDRFIRLVRSVRVIAEPADLPLPEGISLPEKDQPILRGAIAARATHLLTADKTHFGSYFGQTVAGVLILPPEDYLRRRSA